MEWVARHKLTLGLALLLALALVLQVVLLIMPMQNSNAKVIVYEAPNSTVQHSGVSLFVEDTPLFVYDVAVNHIRTWVENPSTTTAGMASFDFEGSVQVRVEVEDMESLVVRPLSLGIQPKVKNGVATFTLSAPAQLTLEINGDYKRAVHLFANAPEENAPSQEDENVIYFGPGVHKTGIFTVESGQTVYLAGGAVVYGGIVGKNVQNVRVTGRGFFDGSTYDRWAQTTVPINFEHSQNIQIDGVGFLNPAGWTVNAYFCEDVLIDNIKIISARSNGDGITLQSCKNVKAQNSFVRSWDDSLVVKNYDEGSTENILFDNMVVWTDLAQSCEVGYETYGESIKNITFQNITVMHNFHKPVMSIHNADQAAISDVTFRDIVVEDAQMGDGDGTPYLMEITIASSQWSRSAVRGSVQNVLFENITVLSGKTPSSNFRGYGENNAVDGVAINNLVINGQRITTLQQGNIKALLYVQNLSIDGVLQEVGAP